MIKTLNLNPQSDKNDTGNTSLQQVPYFGGVFIVRESGDLQAWGLGFGVP